MDKRTKIMKSAIAMIALFMCVGFIGCIDDEKNFHKEDEIGKPNDFDFSTKKTVEFTLKYDVPAGYRVHFEMYTKSPLTLDAYKSYVKDTTLVPFLSGRSDENGKITFKGELSATVDEIYAYSFGIGVPTLMKATVSDAGVVSEFKETEVKAAAVARADEGGPSGTSMWKTYSVTLNKPVLPTAFMTISKDDKTLIDQSFPANQVYIAKNTYYQPYIQLSQNATVNIYSVSHAANSNRTNALAYYVYNSKDISDANIKPGDINSKLQLAFPELTKTTPSEGTGYQLQNNGTLNFEAGSRIGFALFPNITPNNIPTQDTHLLYSIFDNSSWNTYSYPTVPPADRGESRAGVPHMVLSLLRVDGDGHAIIAIGFEDQPWSPTSGTNRGDFRDDIFILEVTPRTALPPDLPTPPTEEDPTYDNEFKTSGILCFEDSWPTKGDYDLNDIVVAYEQSIQMKNGVGPVALKTKYTFLNNGATYRNGFGIQLMGLKKSDIKKCTVDPKSSYAGLDKDLDVATVMIFDNGKDLLSKTVLNTYVTFSNGQYLNGNMNPFIVVRGGKYGAYEDPLIQGRTEVHLPTLQSYNVRTQYFPTKKTVTSYWGTLDDRSVPGSNLFYVREGSYPFALDIQLNSDKDGAVTDFVIPDEGKTIDETYPKFKSWVESGGRNDKDWYLHSAKK